jgi:hypothetical protein
MTNGQFVVMAAEHGAVAMRKTPLLTAVRIVGRWPAESMLDPVRAFVIGWVGDENAIGPISPLLFSISLIELDKQSVKLVTQVARPHPPP